MIQMHSSSSEDTKGSDSGWGRRMWGKRSYCLSVYKRSIYVNVREGGTSLVSMFSTDGVW